MDFIFVLEGGLLRRLLKKKRKKKFQKELGL